jgi:putative ABC transport system substrate-binding protein
MIGLGAVFCRLPCPVFAQQPGKMWRIGYLGDGTAASRAPIGLNPLREGLRELGYIEGKNIVIEQRWTDLRSERLAPLAAELVDAKVDVVVTHGFPATRALKAATSTIPIVVAVVADMLGTGIVASLARPGGNVTGMTDSVVDLSPKEVELLKEALPGMKRVGILWNRRSQTGSKIGELSQAAAEKSKLQVSLLPVEKIDEIDAALNAAVSDRVSAVIVVHDQMTVEYRVRIADALVHRRLASTAGSLWLVEAGLLMSYGPDQTKMFKRAAIFVDKILKGAKPADIPVEEPTQIDLVLNLRTARSLGLTLPPAVLLRANRLIDP